MKWLSCCYDGATALMGGRSGDDDTCLEAVPSADTQMPRVLSHHVLAEYRDQLAASWSGRHAMDGRRGECWR